MTTNNAINGPIPFQWNVVPSAPGDTFNMRSNNGYLTSSINTSRITFVLPGSSDVSVGDEFRVGCWGGSLGGEGGFRVSGVGVARMWQPIFLPPGGEGNNHEAGTMLTTPASINCTRAVHIVCVDNSNPAEAQYLILSQGGQPLTMSTP